MNTTVVLLIGGAVLIALVLIVMSVVLVRRSDQDVLSDRINEFAAREEVASIEDIELSLSFGERIIIPAMRRISNFVSRLAPRETLERTTQQLESAGKSISAAEFYTALLASIVFFTALGVYLSSPGQRLYFILGGLGFGFVLPRTWLTSAVRRRQDQVIKKLPDALDLMMICVDAGLTFDGAMSKVDEKWDDPLSQEFGRVVTEIQLGKTRRQSLKDMSDRLGVPDVQSFVASILQADQLGVGISNVLRIQSEQMRVRRRQRAEEKAQQAPIKMLFPMIFLIFPAMFVVLLGPAAVRVYKTFFL